MASILFAPHVAVTISSACILSHIFSSAGDNMAGFLYLLLMYLSAIITASKKCLGGGGEKLCML
jgi:hypothetical protein